MQFDLSVYRTEDGYFVRVLESPAGDTVELFVQPFLPRELEAFRRAVATLDTGTDGLLESNVHLVHELGSRLFTALFPKSVHTMLQTSYRMAYEARAQLRIRLQLAEAPELAILPWEYIYDPTRNEFPALSLHSPLIRYTSLMHHIPPLKVELPLKMLVIIAAPSGYPAVNKDAIWYSLVDTLDYLALDDRLRLEQLRKPTLLDLQRRLRAGDCHMLHIISYGSYDEFTEDGILVLEDEMGRSRPVNGQHLGALLRDHFPLRLAVLSAMEPQRTTKPNPQLAAGQSFIRRGLPAVVAVQSAFDAQSTNVFAQNFYAQIADFAPVDQALTEARRALEATSASAAWGLPSLLTRIPDGQLFIDPATVSMPMTAGGRLRTLNPPPRRTNW
ncbi:MAG: CHAT domain-containing protein [Caldilineaceae bacterium]